MNAVVGGGNQRRIALEPIEKTRKHATDNPKILRSFAKNDRPGLLDSLNFVAKLNI
jgi:hypothetical protein